MSQCVLYDLQVDSLMNKFLRMSNLVEDIPGNQFSFSQLLSKFNSVDNKAIKGSAAPLLHVWNVILTAA